ncbi:hypothetical protein D1872_300760 [compost metagenome]
MRELASTTLKLLFSICFISRWNWDNGRYTIFHNNQPMAKLTAANNTVNRTICITQRFFSWS